MNIAKVIKNKGFTIQQVADEIGVNRVTLARTIGKNANPTISTLEKIANVLGVSVVELLTESDETKAPHETIIISCPHCGNDININIE